MKVHFTKKEYRLLLDIFSIAEWVMNSHKVGDNPKSEPYKKLEQKVFSYAKDFGFENLVMYDKVLNQYFPTRKYEDLETDRPFIEEFEEEVFWDELCNRLAQRDLLQKKGIQKTKKRAKADGQVTKKERAKIHARQNQASKNIYRKKNNRKKPGN